MCRSVLRLRTAQSPSLRTASQSSEATTDITTVIAIAVSKPRPRTIAKPNCPIALPKAKATASQAILRRQDPFAGVGGALLSSTMLRRYLATGLPRRRSTVPLCADSGLSAGHDVVVSKQSKQEWAAVEEIVRRALHDQIDLANPPTTDDDLMWLAAGVTDHIVGAFVTQPRRR